VGSCGEWYGFEKERVFVGWRGDGYVLVHDGEAFRDWIGG
jgi:hypothetical protein